MTPQVAEALRIVAARKPLPRDLAERTFLDLMDGKATEAQKGALLLGIATRGETAEEIAGAVAALRTRMRRVQTRRSPLLDTCGPGGIGRDLFNISTAAAVVAAGAGAAVAKHGNRSISSRVGSADVLSACGVAIDLGPETAGRVLDMGRPRVTPHCTRPPATATTRYSCSCRRGATTFHSASGWSAGM